MKTQKRYIVIVLSVLLVLIGITAATLAVSKPSEPIPISKGSASLTITPDKPIVTVNAQEIIQLTNDYRATKGLAPFVENELLDQSACAKAQHMVDNKYWAHISPDGIQPWYFYEQAGYMYSRAGENLAYGHRTSYSVVDGWINSPKHQENLVYPYNDIGICVLINQSYQGGNNTVIVAHYGTLIQ